VVARVEADGSDLPFTYGRPVESPAFERFRRNFTDPNEWPDGGPELEASCGEVRAHGGFLRREVPTGVAYRGVCPTPDGGEAG
jgi:hypothetical protein